MRSLWRVFAIVAVTSGVLTNFAKADDQLMEGVKSFVCDREPIVLLGSDSDWVFTDEPEIEVHRTNNGWRLGDQGIGFIGFLQKRATDDWVLESLSEDGFVEIQCIDVTESTSKVVSAIRPRLNENIIDIQEQLAVVNQQLATASADYEALQAEYDLSTGQHSSELSMLRLRHLEEIKSHKVTLVTLQSEYSALQNKYDKLQNDYDLLYSRLLDGKEAEMISAQLDALVAMSPGERNALIARNSLGTKGIKRPGLLGYCAKTLRDKARMDHTCRIILIEFLLQEGL